MPERADTSEVIGLIMFAPPLYSTGNPGVGIFWFEVLEQGGSGAWGGRRATKLGAGQRAKRGPLIRPLATFSPEGAKERF